MLYVVCYRSWTLPLAGGLSGKTTEVPHGPGCLQQQAPGCIDRLKVPQICLILAQDDFDEWVNERGYPC